MNSIGASQSAGNLVGMGEDAGGNGNGLMNNFGCNQLKVDWKK
jgi:hypothetical protein